MKPLFVTLFILVALTFAFGQGRQIEDRRTLLFPVSLDITQNGEYIPEMPAAASMLKSLYIEVDNADLTVHYELKKYNGLYAIELLGFQTANGLQRIPVERIEGVLGEGISGKGPLSHSFQIINSADNSNIRQLSGPVVLQLRITQYDIVLARGRDTISCSYEIQKLTYPENYWGETIFGGLGATSIFVSLHLEHRADVHYGNYRAQEAKSDADPIYEDKVRPNHRGATITRAAGAVLLAGSAIWGLLRHRNNKKNRELQRQLCPELQFQPLLGLPSSLPSGLPAPDGTLGLSLTYNF